MAEHYVDRAEKAIKKMIVVDKNGREKINLTTSKIRNILSLVSDLYNDAQRYRSEELSEDLYNRVQYLKMRMAYEAGRENTVKDFLEAADLLKEINKIGKSKKALLEFCHYMEALVAYHKFYGGKEN